MEDADQMADDRLDQLTPARELFERQLSCLYTACYFEDILWGSWRLGKFQSKKDAENLIKVDKFSKVIWVS